MLMHPRILLQMDAYERIGNAHVQVAALDVGLSCRVDELEREGIPHIAVTEKS